VWPKRKRASQGNKCSTLQDAYSGKRDNEAATPSGVHQCNRPEKREKGGTAAKRVQGAQSLWGEKSGQNLMVHRWARQTNHTNTPPTSDLRGGCKGGWREKFGKEKAD